MAQQISIEEAFPTFQKKCSELFEANLVLTAQVDVLTKQLDAARVENEQLKASSAEASQSGSDVGPQPSYPDTAGDQG